MIEPRKTFLDYIMIILEIVLGIVIVGFIVDFIGFMLWIASGQFPADNFYIGICTAKTLKALLF